MNRRERRRLEKQFGLMKQYQNGSKEQRAEIRTRRLEMGQKLHEQHLENMENSLREQKEKKDVEQLQGWIDKGYTIDEAKKMIADNDRLSEKRAEKLEARMQRQKQDKKLKKH